MKDENLELLKGELDFYKPVTHELSFSEIENLRKLSEPISANLLNLKQETRSFLNEVKKENEELISGSALKWVEEKRYLVEQEMLHLYQGVQGDYASFAHDFERLKLIMAEIFERTRGIEDIADKINILSINASIESARAGVAGRGFKVIAGEIKTLVEETSGFIAGIDETVKEASLVFSEFENSFDQKKNMTINRLEEQKTNFAQFSQIFQKHYQNFNTLYNDILSFIDRLSEQITELSPLIQSHEITIQEMENFDRVLQEFIKTAEARLSGFDLTIAQKNLLHIELTERVRRKLTTSGELKSLEKALLGLGISHTDLKNSYQAVELF